MHEVQYKVFLKVNDTECLFTLGLQAASQAFPVSSRMTLY